VSPATRYPIAEHAVRRGNGGWPWRELVMRPPALLLADRRRATSADHRRRWPAARCTPNTGSRRSLRRQRALARRDERSVAVGAQSAADKGLSSVYTAGRLVRTRRARPITGRGSHRRTPDQQPGRTRPRAMRGPSFLGSKGDITRRRDQAPARDVLAGCSPAQHALLFTLEVFLRSRA
jgi:hypothetical protein